jgi:hypothetical protein
VSDRQARRALVNLEASGLLARHAQITPNDGQTHNIYEIYGIDAYRTEGQGGMTDSQGDMTDGQRGPDCQAGPLDDLEQPLLNSNKTSPPSPPEGGAEDKPQTPTEREKLWQEAIIGEYNRILPELSRAETVSNSRRNALRRCLKQDAARKEIDWWRRYFERVRGCPWLLGQNPSGWRANLDWLLRDEPMQKVIEGAYTGHGGRTADGEAAQKNFTNEGGEVDARALLRNIGAGRN